LCGLAPNAWTLIAFRALQAVGGALLIPASLALVIRATPPRDLPVSVAVWGALGAVSGAIGPTLGAGIIAALGWRGVFFLNVPVGIATWVLGRRTLRESANPETPAPALSGVALVAVGAAVASLGFVQSEAWGWSDPRTVGSLTLGAALLVVFSFLQRTSSAPVVDPGLFRHPTFVWANVASVALGLAFTAMFLGSILFLTQVWGWSTLAAGLGVSPGPTLVAFVAPRLGSLARRTGQKPMILLGGLVFAASGLHRYVFLDLEPDYLIDYLPSMLLSSLGIALTIPQLSSSIAQSIPSSHLGVGTATNQAIRQFAGTFGVALAIAFVGDAASPTEAMLGFNRVWLLMVGSGVATTLLALPIRPRT
ncbi:MAG: MFS transporter, partial [Myxococcota bacterium]